MLKGVLKRKRSHIWTYYNPTENNRAECKICNKTISIAAGSLGNLTRHLKKQHHSNESVKSDFEQQILGANQSYTTDTGDIVRVRKKSNVWLHFQQHPDYKGLCMYCQKIISYTSHSTGNLTRHLKLLHPNEFEKNDCFKQEIQLHIKSANDDGNEYEGQAAVETIQFNTFEDETNLPTSAPSIPTTVVTSKKKKKIKVESKIGNLKKETGSKEKIVLNKTTMIPANRTKTLNAQLLKMLIKEYHDFSLIQEHEFINFVQMLFFSYTLPSIPTLETLLKQAYDSLRKKILEDLRNVHAVCLNVESWIGVNNLTWFSVTAHYINEQTEVNSALLECSSFTNTAHNITKFLKDLANQWDIFSKVIVVVTDNSQSMVEATAHLKWRHLSCFVNSINNVVQEGLKHDTIIRILARARELIEFFRRNPSAMETLQETHKQLQTIDVELYIDMDGKWSSTLEMLDKLNKLKISIIEAFPNLDTTILPILPMPPSLQEFEIFERLMQILQIFNTIKKEIASEKFFTASKILILLKLLKSKLFFFFQESDHTFYEKEDIVHIFLEQIGISLKSYEDEDDLLTEATLLDPKFKKLGFSDENKFQTAYSVLCTKLALIQVPTSEEILEPSTSQIEQTQNDVSENSFWQEFDEELKHMRDVNNSHNEGTIELEKYINEPLLDRKGNSSVWWNTRKILYPRLYEFVKRRFCIIGTSIPSSRIFAKNKLEEKRSELVQNVSEIVFLNHNM